jgi:hypothetical protein
MECVRDSTLVIEVPRNLVLEAFSCDGQARPYGYELVTFVDGIDTGKYFTILGGEFETWDLELEAGSEGIEIVGACAP